jgi:hypothetical protein
MQQLHDVNLDVQVDVVVEQVHDEDQRAATAAAAESQHAAAAARRSRSESSASSSASMPPAASTAAGVAIARCVHKQQRALAVRNPVVSEQPRMHAQRAERRILNSQRFKDVNNESSQLRPES